jgi:hypothetical protein
MEYVFAAVTSDVLYTPVGAVQLNHGDVWFADDPFVAHRSDLFSSTPVVVRSTTGREAPPATAVGTRAPRAAKGKARG